MKKLNIILTTIILLMVHISTKAQSTVPIIQVTSGSDHKSETSMDIDPNNISHFFIGSNVRIGTEQTKIGYYYSSDNGISWTSNQNFDNEHRVDPSVAYDLLGNVYYCFLKPDQNSSLDEIHIKKSSNNGVNWISDVKLSNNYSDKCYLTIDKKSTSPYVNNIYVVWAYNLSSIGFRRSNDGGSTYSNVNYIDGTFNSVHAPVPATGPNGELYVAWAIGSTATTGIGFNKSINGGAGFGNAVQIANVSQIGYVVDNHYRLKNTGIRVNSWPVIDVDKTNGNIYVSWSDNSNGNPDIFIIKSTDQGVTWSNKIKVNNDNTANDQWFPWLNVGADGAVNVVYYDSRNDVSNLLTQVYLSRSTNGGQTFSDYQVTEYSFTPKPIPGSPAADYMGDYIGITSAGTKVYPCWMDDHNSNIFQLYTAALDFSTQIDVDQVEELSQSNRISLQVGRWEGGSAYHFRDVPFSLPVNVGANEYLIGSSELFSNKKFHEWNIEDYYTLMDTFEINLGTNNFKSLFFNSVNGITIKNNYFESTSINPQDDNISFADPWLNDTDAPFDGTKKINKIINPPLKERQSPFYPDYTASYNGDVYKGVFLNQNPTFDPLKPIYSVKVDAVQDIPLTQTGKTHRFYFQNWGGTNANFQNSNALETPVVFTLDGATAQANLKGTQLSGTTTGFSNSSQRKLVTTQYPDYNYHLVYGSSGSVWYEKAGINAETVTPSNWQLMNGAKPIDGELNITQAKSPSIDYVYATHSTAEENYYIYIVYQKKKSDGKYEIRLVKFNQSGIKIFDIQVYNSTYTNYSSYDCMPVIGVTKLTGGDGRTKLVVLWKMPNEGALSAGLYYFAGFDEGDYISWTDSYPSPFKISTTDANSTNPSIAIFKKPDANLYFHLAYQQGTSQIKYAPIIFGVNGSSNEITPSIVSSGSGSSTNISPSITVGNTRSVYPIYGNAYDSPKIVWCNLDDGGNGFYRYRTSMQSASWSPFYIYGENDDVQSPTISGPKYHPYGFNDTFQFGWSWLVGYFKSYVETNNLSQKLSLPYHGKDFQIANNYDDWDGFGYCVLDNVTRSSAPFTFENKWVNPPLNKSGITNIHSGRAGTVIKNEAEFYFAFGDIKLDDSDIEFGTLSDTITISTLNDLNSNLRTKPFEVNDNSVLIYSVFYGLTDSLLAVNSLSSTDQMNFKIEVIEDKTKQILGTFDNIVQTKQHLIEYENNSYQVELRGIGNKTIRLHLVVTNNFLSDYSLSNIFSFDQILGKQKINIVTWDDAKAVKDYALEQNFPNPFNPSTTIKYQLPKDGMVTLKIYDILGSEVATLVNEEKAEGRYEVNFDASSLASGVYIYRIAIHSDKIQAGSFVNSKKMLLLK